MPLLLRRRSVLDLLNANVSKTDDNNTPESTNRQNLRPDDASSIVRPRSEHSLPASRLSHQLQPEEVDADSPEPPTSRSRSKRFSMNRFRNQSEPRLSTRGNVDENEEDDVPPMPSDNPVPSIVKTAPTMHHAENVPAESTPGKPSLFRKTGLGSKNKDMRKSRDMSRVELADKQKTRSTSSRWRRIQGKNNGVQDLHRLSSMMTAHQGTNSAPPSYGDESNSALALPVPRFSESSQSDGSNASSGDVYGTTTTTTHTVSTHTTFFKLPRRNKNRNSLFPLPARTTPPSDEASNPSAPGTPRPSTSALSTRSARPESSGRPAPVTALRRRHTESVGAQPHVEHPPLPLSHAAIAKSSLSFAEPGTNLFREGSQRSRASSTSLSNQQPISRNMRDRASTTSSWGRLSHDLDTPPPLPGSGRNSVSTMTRQSLGGFLNLARFRQGSDPNSRHGSPGTRSKSNSFALSREALVIPDREEGDTPGKYLERLESALARSMIAGILSRSADPFAQAVLRSYTRRFPFFGEPIDMSLRKFLLEAELPKETQQVDRVIQAFADRYHECNPGIFVAPDQAYIIAFSLMMLHTDAFNKNNKRKMQKQDYIKNTSGQQVSDDVLACFYDNICYTPFVHYEEEVDINGERVMPFKPKPKGKLKGVITETGVVTKKQTGPVDPYELLIEQKLDSIRPSIKETITFDDPYNFRGSQGEPDQAYLQRAFTHTGILQIVSARSRPAAYEGQMGAEHAPNPTETQAGIVDLKITKVGTLWRKSTKKKKTRSPWQEWGAILTGSQLYLFKNAHWAKGLLHQFTAAQRHGQPRNPVIFKPPLNDFKPDALIKTDNAVALVDSSYTRHKNAFTFFRAGGQEEVLLADNESDLNDWLSLINYAAAFRAAGVRIRGMVGGNEENLRARELNRPDSSSSPSAQDNSSALLSRAGFSPQLHRQVMAARRQIMVQKISEEERDITDTVKQLDTMLRNARHLLVLAPIAPKSRDDIIHAAAKADATIKWIRRDIWRMKCHRDILALDVQQDGVSASELLALTTSEQQSSGSPEARGTVKKDASRAARSPPQSPLSTASRNRRESETSSIETFMGGDVFRTAPESLQKQQSGGGDGYRLPPLQLDVNPRENLHRASVTSTLISNSSQGHSLSHASSTSSARPAERPASPTRTKSNARHSLASQEESRAELLARSTMPPAGEPSGLDGTTATPESSTKHKSVRRSLQKTLRDGHRNGSVNKHRRGRESDGTIRHSGVGSATGNSAQAGGSNGATPGEATGDKDEEITPGLQREKGRFILHGKQASVIQFGSEWSDKARREKWVAAAAAGEENGASDSDRRPSDTTGMGSPIVREFSHASTADVDSDEDDDDEEETTPSKKREKTPTGSAEKSPRSNKQKRNTIIGPAAGGKGKTAGVEAAASPTSVRGGAEHDTPGEDSDSVYDDAESRSGVEA